VIVRGPGQEIVGSVSGMSRLGQSLIGDSWTVGILKIRHEVSVSGRDMAAE
jgi:hypothetical protein